jgi:hypothetical protein
MASGHTCFVLSRAKPSSVTPTSDMPVASTNLKRDTSNTEDSFCNWIQLKCVNVLCHVRFRVDVAELTSAKTAPILSALSTDLSTDPLISGEYFSSKSSSSWSVDRNASAYENIISWRQGAVAKVRTVPLAENSNSRDPLCFPMTTGPVLLY